MKILIGLNREDDHLSVIVGWHENRTDFRVYRVKETRPGCWRLGLGQGCYQAQVYTTEADAVAGALSDWAIFTKWPGANDADLG